MGEFMRCFESYANRQFDATKQLLSKTPRSDPPGTSSARAPGIAPGFAPESAPSVDSGANAIHDIRLIIKRLRALLRLLQPLSPAEFRKPEQRLRTIAA
jgi:hypothetical protein